jgi:iron complex outermembrane receptor protein
MSLRDDLQLSNTVSLHPAVRLDAVGAQTGLSPGITAAWTSDPWQVRAGWGLSFRPPTFAELYLTSGGLAPNPDLRPERAWSADAGLAFRRGALRLSGSVFWSQYRELILYVLNPSANQVKPFNIGSARIAGAEIQAVIELPAGFLAEASYSFLASENLRPGAQEGQALPYRPPHRLFARLARHGARVEGYAESSFTSSMPRNSYDSARLPAQAVFNAGAGIRPAGPLWIDVEVKNLLDDQTLEDLFQYPLPGRSIAVIARARL